MKYIIFFITLLISIWVQGQNNPVLDTLFSNEVKNVALFFPQPIKRALTGSPNFVFSYNKEKPEPYGLLQATPGGESNLLVITQSGAIFSYILKYSNDLKELNYFLHDSQSIGKVTPASLVLDKKEDGLNTNQVARHYDRFCKQLVGLQRKIHSLKKKSNDIILRVENIVFSENEFYFVIHIDNRSSLPYDLNFLKLSLQTRQRGKRKSAQSLTQQPIYCYEMPRRIAKNGSMRLVLVYPKFSLDSDRKAVLELNELNGARNLKLSVSQRYINNPN